MAELETRVLPKCPLAQAIGYAFRQWAALTIYTTDGRLEIDNNAAERALRGVAVGRKNRWEGKNFVAVCGPLNSRGTPIWARYAPVRSGLARFAALPPGPAVIKVLSRTSEIGREWVDLRPGADVNRATVRISKGELRIRHDSTDGAPRRFELARRSQRLGSIDGWVAIGGPLGGPLEAHYAGLADGSYCLWVLEDGSAQRLDLEIHGELVELDLRSMAGELTSVRIERGPGAAPDGAIEIELVPQQWHEVTPVDGVLALSHGAHRTRTTTTGIGYITRRIDVPHEERIQFDGPTSATPVEVASDFVWKATTVVVTPQGALTPPQRSRSLSLYFDRQGRGQIDLLPGAYVLTDRGGGQVSITVEPGTGAVLVRIP